MFHKLTEENLKVIVDIELNKVRERLEERGLNLILTDEARLFIIEKGKDDDGLDYGARPLRRSVERFIEDPLSEELLRGAFEGNNMITVDVKELEAVLGTFREDVRVGTPLRRWITHAEQELRHVRALGLCQQAYFLCFVGRRLDHPLHRRGEGAVHEISGAALWVGRVAVGRNVAIDTRTVVATVRIAGNAVPVKGRRIS